MPSPRASPREGGLGSPRRLATGAGTSFTSGKLSDGGLVWSAFSLLGGFATPAVGEPFSGTIAAESNWFGCSKAPAMGLFAPKCLGSNGARESFTLGSSTLSAASAQGLTLRPGLLASGAPASLSRKASPAGLWDASPEVARLVAAFDCALVCCCSLPPAIVPSPCTGPALRPAPLCARATSLASGCAAGAVCLGLSESAFATNSWGLFLSLLAPQSVALRMPELVSLMSSVSWTIAGAWRGSSHDEAREGEGEREEARERERE
eukprot:scaffold8237_cov27-Tisochrysis_lutea.AAC.3